MPLTDLFDYAFLRQAALAGALASVLCGAVGTFVVVKRLVHISGGISHAAFGGLGVCVFLGFDPRLGAAAVAVLSALLLAGVGESRSGSRDAAIGVLWALGMAVGMVFVARAPAAAPNLASYLFGNVLAVRASDVWLTAALALVVVAALALLYKDLLAVAFDEAFARVQGVPVRALLAGLLVLVALSVVLLIQLVGIVLVIALLTIPPLVALRWAHGFLAVVVASMFGGLVMTLAGLAASFAWDLPSGPAMVLVGALGLAASWCLDRLRMRRPRLAA
jgi:zinc transport system permease protein